ncbi:hypothetical protein CC030809_00247 [Synechococcus phage S-CAM7]|uniref:Uncharacterized protein n=1 Tax=Synechococcus phage S-CAM7 TaxID=1883368 RepID=A0A7D5FUQ0_9CAUD|nr:hypothetical protein CC030809_00247 [Synechococcus phage S-CAM7]
MSKGITNLLVQVDHSDGHKYTFTKDFHGIKIKYTSDLISEDLPREVFIPDNSVSAIIHALSLISQNPEY